MNFLFFIFFHIIGAKTIWCVVNLATSRLKHSVRPKNNKHGTNNWCQAGDLNFWTTGGHLTIFQLQEGACQAGHHVRHSTRPAGHSKFVIWSLGQTVKRITDVRLVTSIFGLQRATLPFFNQKKEPVKLVTMSGTQLVPGDIRNLWYCALNKLSKIISHDRLLTSF